MYTAYKLIFMLHIVAGAFSLLIFWLPMLGKKGTQNHRKFGRWFVTAMKILAISGFVMSSMVLMDPVGVTSATRGISIEQATERVEWIRMQFTFLFMLSALVYASLRQATLVLEAKEDRAQLKSLSHLGLLIGLGIISVLIGLLGLQQNNILFQIFAVIGLLNAAGSLRYIFKANIKQREWLLEHIGNIIGCGIASYTAFFAFGGRRFLDDVLTGSWQLLPWTLPAAIGITATFWLSKKYSKTYRITEQQGA